MSAFYGLAVVCVMFILSGLPADGSQYSNSSNYYDYDIYYSGDWYNITAYDDINSDEESYKVSTTALNEDNFQPDDYSTSISRATVAIIWSFYVPVSSVLSFTRASISQDTEWRQSDFVNEILINCRAKVGVTVEHYWSLSESEKRFFNIMFVDGYRAFRKIYENMNELRYDYTGFYTIVLTESTHYQYDTITKILEDCWAIQITNVLILISIDPQARTALYTYFPYTQFHCEAVAPVIVNFFSQDNKFLYPTELFPPKTRNLYNCPLLVATYEVPPYMMLTEREDGNFDMNGIDGITIRVLSQKMHFTPIVKIPPKKERRGLLRPNGTSTGLMRMIYSGDVNMSIGAMAYTVGRLQYLSSSIPYYQCAIVFVVPKGRPFTAFEKLFMPFRIIIWSCIVIVFGMGLVVIIALRFNRNRRDFVVGPRIPTPYMNMVAVFLGSSMTILPRRNFARFLLTVWMIGCIVLRNAYQGSMFQFLQTPKISSPIQTIDEMTAANFSLYMEPLLFFLFDNIPKAKPYLRESPFASNEEEFEMLQTDRSKEAYLSNTAVVAYYNKMNRHGTVQASNEVVFIAPLTIYFRKHSCLTATVNQEINQYMSSGLLDNWVRLFATEDYLMLSKKPPPRQHRSLHLHQVGGAFTMCTYMILGSCAVFGLEVLSLRVAFLRRLFLLI